LLSVPYRKHHSSVVVCGSLPKSGQCSVAYLSVAVKQLVCMQHCSLLKAIHLEKSIGIPPFLLFQGLCLWHLWSVMLSFPLVRLPWWLLLNCSHCWSASLIKLGQVYHHHPQTRVQLDHVYYVIYSGDYHVWCLPWGLGSRNSLPNTRLAWVKPIILCPIPSCTIRRLFVGALWLFWCSTQPCHSNAGAGVMRMSCSLPGVAKSPVSDDNGSYGHSHNVAPMVLLSGRKSW
jgi:hypothetical protein